MINFTHTEGALFTSLIISLIAAVLTIFGWIRFSITAILLLVALVAGLIVAKQNILDFNMNVPFSENTQALNSIVSGQEKASQKLEWIRKEIEEQKHTIQTLTDELIDVKKEQELLKKETKQTLNQEKNPPHDISPQIPFPLSP